MTDAATNTAADWVGAWYAAPAHLITANLSGRTLRQIVHLHAAGEQLRLRLSNRYGVASVTLASVSVGHVLQGPIVAPGAVAASFAGQTTLTLEPGQEVVSDPVALPVSAFSDLAITFFLSQGDSMSGHSFALQTSYVSGQTDVTAAAIEATMFAYPLQTSSWWLISGVDVLPSAPLNAVVAFGSSTTDGVGSTPNANSRWPDYLARRLRDAERTRFMSVLNAGIGGNTLTFADVPGMMGTGLPSFMFGEAGVKRLGWDVLGQPGATDLIVHIGSNDLRIGVAGTNVIVGLQQLATQARQSYQRVFGTTILPGGYLPEQVAQRQLVNSWLREHGSQCFDAVFDFAAPLAAAANEAVFDPAYDSGDGVHPNDTGYRLMAEAVDINSLTGSPGQPPFGI